MYTNKLHLVSRHIHPLFASWLTHYVIFTVVLAFHSRCRFIFCRISSLRHFPGVSTNNVQSTLLLPSLVAPCYYFHYRNYLNQFPDRSLLLPKFSKTLTRLSLYHCYISIKRYVKRYSCLNIRCTYLAFEVLQYNDNKWIIAENTAR